MFKFLKKREAAAPPSEEAINKELVYYALKVLSDVDARGKKATKADLNVAIQEAIGYLSQITVE